MFLILITSPILSYSFASNQCLCLSAFLYACIYSYVSVYTCKCMFIFTLCVGLCLYVCLCVYVCVFVCLSIWVCGCKHVYKGIQCSVQFHPKIPLNGYPVTKGFVLSSACCCSLCMGLTRRVVFQVNQSQHGMRRVLSTEQR